MRLWTISLSIAALTACAGGAPAECGEAECAKYIASASSGDAPTPTEPAVTTEAGAGSGSAAGLTDFEQRVVDPMLEDIRAGVRPFTPESVGICKGQGKECDEYLGLEVGELPEGEYMVRAELLVPKTGDLHEWQVRFETECTTTRETDGGSSESTTSNSKEYDVRYAGEERGYRLSPLFRIDSPHSSGARSCSWKLVSPHPDGDKVVEGSWSTPAPG